LSAVVHSLAAGALGFRGIFALAIVPLVGVYALRNRVEEPRRFMVAEAAAEHPTPVWGAVGRRYRGRVIVLAAIGFAISIVTGPANSFAFLYAQDVLHLAGWVTATVVVVSGAAGGLGLLAGRWLADRVGRRLTGTVALVGVACTGALAYTGSESAYVAGYIVGVFSGGLLAPAVGAMLAELFPTSVRASVTGWWVTAGVLGAVSGLVAFGTVADVGNQFAAAAELTFLPAAAAAALFWLLPETKGYEPEALWPEPGPRSAPD
jgi:MFS family permease